MGSHIKSHEQHVPAPRFDPHRALNRGERLYIRKRIEWAAQQLALELHLPPAVVLACIPKILTAPKPVPHPVDPADIPLTGPGMIVGIQLGRSR